MGDGEKESELCSVCSVGVIRTAIMIDFVPVPTRTPLPFFFFFPVSPSRAHRQLRGADTRGGRTHFLSLSQLGQP